MALIEYTKKAKNIDKLIASKGKNNIDYINLKISKDVKLARVKRGITQSELAKKIGTKQSSISRLESGKISPSISFLNDIAIALDTTLIEPRFESTEDKEIKKYYNPKPILSTSLRDKE